MIAIKKDFVKHSPQDLVNVNEWKIMFDPNILSFQGHERLRKKLFVDEESDAFCQMVAE